NKCKLKMKTTVISVSGTSDTDSCWPAASVGESTLYVASRFPVFFLFTVLITRNCTMQGWSKPSLPYYIACYYEDYVEEEQSYFDTLMLIYSVGYGASLAALFIAILVFCCFRKLLCTRTYIHINLFSTFILRSLAVFIKDAVLFADKNVDHCTVSTPKCKAAVTFFQYCVLANFFWLLVESLYLQTLLVFTFTHKRTLFWVYAVIGWGKLCVYIPLCVSMHLCWALFHCWDNLDSGLWWIIKTPILLSIFVRHVIFTPFPYLYRIRRLLRSTLLLVPLFGLHYVVFALFPDSVGTGPRLYLELLLGSFQVPDLSTLLMKTELLMKDITYLKTNLYSCLFFFFFFFFAIYNYPFIIFCSYVNDKCGFYCSVSVSLNQSLSLFFFFFFFFFLQKPL
uniref:Growth hormone releasing hormone receptor 2 n=1 Tax=Myripristis murdjan TaxID=586833 RepID=A0A668AWY0_9TELE